MAWTLDMHSNRSVDIFPFSAQKSFPDSQHFKLKEDTHAAADLKNHKQSSIENVR